MGFRQSLVHLDKTTSFFNGQYDSKNVTITICCALALYNAIELLLLIFTTFRKYHGLYFWSMLIATAGIVPYTIGFMIEYYQLTAQLAGEIIATVGWPMMVTGQSLVLYSRLGVVLGPSHANVLKAVKWMIIIDAIVFHVSTTVVMFGAYNARDDQPFQQAYKYVEKVQMTAFTIQEFVLSGLYVWRTLDILNASTNPRRKRIMRELLSINIFIIIMDIALLVVEYQDRHPMEQAIKVVVYSIKLKFEFAILSKLVSIFERGDDAGADMFDEYERRQEIAKPEVKLVQQTARRDSKMAVKSEDEGALHIERASSWFSGTTYLDDNGSAIQPQLPKETLDLQRRRRTLEDDFYASALRDVSG